MKLIYLLTIFLAISLICSTNLKSKIKVKNCLLNKDKDFAGKFF